MEEALLNGVGETDGDYGVVKSVSEATRVFWVESVKLWKIAAPLVFQTLCNYATNSVTTIFVGHLGELELSAVSIALSVIGTFSFGFMLGMGSALETLCGQAFGAGQIHMLGIYMQRSWIILFVSCVAILPIYIFATPVLKLLGQEHDIADAAGTFCLLIIPQLFSLAFNFPTQKFLQSQSKVNVLAWIGFLTLIGHIVILWLFISVLGWGLNGAAVAFDITSWVTVVAQLIYVFGWCNDAWTGFSWAAFKDLWAFLRLSIASAVMLCLEVWYLMSVSLLAGHLNDAVIAVGSLSIWFEKVIYEPETAIDIVERPKYMTVIVYKFRLPRCVSIQYLLVSESIWSLILFSHFSLSMNLNGIQAMIFIGINAAVSVRVSNELGLLHPRATKYSVYTAVSQSLVIGLLCMVLVLVGRDYFAFIYTDSKELQVAVSKLAWLLGVTMVLNSIQPVISGVAVGGGWQGLVAYINLGCYYALGLPLGYVLGYVADLGAAGIWGGMIIGTALQTLILIFILYQTNWNTEVEETTSRMQKWGGKDIKAVQNGAGNI